MLYHSDADAPSPQHGVLESLKRIDPGMFAFWRKHEINYATGQRLVTYRGRPVRNPRWYVYLKRPDGKCYFLFHTKVMDQRVPTKILSDVARRMTAEQVDSMISDITDRQKVREEMDENQKMADFMSANKSKLSRVFDGDNVKRGAQMRDQKIVSYKGQPHRSSGLGSVPVSSKEGGWESPWGEEEEE